MFIVRIKSTISAAKHADHDDWTCWRNLRLFRACERQQLLCALQSATLLLPSVRNKTPKNDMADTAAP